MLKTPVALAHFYWSQILKAGDLVLDATCGQGQDTLFLAQRALKMGAGEVHAIDIQGVAIEKTRARMKINLQEVLLGQISYYEMCHSKLETLKAGLFDLIVYNLGYLPQGDKSLTTASESSLMSFDKALYLLKKGAFLSITCYPGHSQGALEEEATLKWASGLPSQYEVCHHRWLNRSEKAPSLLLIQRKL